jgi:hypothetical protein
VSRIAHIAELPLRFDVSVITRDGYARPQRKGFCFAPRSLFGRCSLYGCGVGFRGGSGSRSLHELLAGSVREWVVGVARTFMVSNRFDMFFGGADFDSPFGGAVFGVELMATFAMEWRGSMGWW